MSFGLPVDFAGKVVKMSSRNANRTMKEQVMRNKNEKRQLMTLGTEQRRVAERRLAAEKDRAEFEALLHVLNAQEEGMIGRRNTLKMDE